MPANPTDEAFAKYANEHGIATLDQIEAARVAQVEKARQGILIALSDVLVSQGIITPALRENIGKKVQAQQQGGVKQLGNYRLLKKLGEGGMGAVYLAEDVVAMRKVAVKVLPKKYAGEAEFLTRFRREAKAAGKLNHSNIVAAYSVGEEMGHHFYVMEYCEGEPIDAMLKRLKVLPWDKAVEIVSQVARGLEHAHKYGFIHRDIKPANVLMTKDGTAKILDLGLSKNIGDAEQSFHTQTGVALGTPQYISPEQAQGDRNIDGRTDIYSLGAMFYHLLTGQTPFQASTAAAVIMKHLTEQLSNPQDVNPDIPDTVVHVVQRMMAKAPADRYANAAELLADLELIAQGKAPSSLAIDAVKSSIAMPRARKESVPPGADQMRPGRRGPTGNHTPVSTKRSGTLEDRRDDRRDKTDRRNAPRTVNKTLILVGVVAGAVIAGIAFSFMSEKGTAAKVEMASTGPPVPAGPPVIEQTPEKNPGEKHIAKEPATPDVTPAPVTTPPPPERPRFVLECETMRMLNKSPASVLDVQSPGFQWSRGQQRWFRSDFANGSFTLEMPVQTAGWYSVKLLLTKGPDYGRVNISLDGKVLNDVDGYDIRLHPAPVDLGEMSLVEGPHELRIAVPSNRGRGAFIAGVDAVILEALTAAPANAAAETEPVNAKGNPVGAALAEPKRINLLAYIDLAKDAVLGTWTQRDGALLSDATGAFIKEGGKGGARLQIPYRPPEEYDLRVAFTRQSGEHCVVLLFPSRKGETFALIAGGWSNRFLGFELVNGAGSEDPRRNTSSRPGTFLRTGTRQEMLLQVRKNGATVSLDGREITRTPAHYEGMTPPPWYALKDPALLGIASWASPTVFHSIEIVEISGKGRDIRE